jgi:hypothetical protein
LITGILDYSLIHSKPMNRACLTKNTNLHEQNQHASSIRPLKNNYVRMKKLILSSVALSAMLFLFNSCAKETKTEFTDEQKATIQKEVKDQWDKQRSTIGQLNFDTWSEFVSNEFISGIGPTNYIPARTAWMDTIKNSYSLRERHQSELLDRTVTALTPDLALGTQIAIWDNWFKNGDYRKVKGSTTILWKKEPDGWKIIYVHESRMAILEEKLANSPQ